ncbi:uncharacterized protein LOC141538394 isoform X1 [Cotesia typhae]|uniref:uncharacterized protein LOC141538394 isoform X1 n=1 Tax=Cotesia typhae TaxID=2053667 RepID=UPI003D68C68B
MEKLVVLHLLECESNKTYSLKVTPEIYDRAKIDTLFATKLLMRHINDGISVFAGSLSSCDLLESNTTDDLLENNRSYDHLAKKQFSNPNAGTSTAGTSSGSRPTATSSVAKSSRSKETASVDIDKRSDSEVLNPPSKRHKKLADYCEQLLEEKKENRAIRMQHHQEKIAAINQLTDVLRELMGHAAQKRQS